MLGDGLQGAQGKGQEQSQVGNEGQPGQAAQPGDRPSSDWVRNLGASEVDAQTAQWVEAFANPAALPSSQGIQVASAPIGTVGDAGYFDDSGAYIEPPQLIWPDGTTSTLAQSSDGEPMLAETEARETAQPMLPEDFRRQEIEYRNSTEVQPPQYSFTELVEMSHSPVDSYSAQEYRDAAAQYRASMGEDFRRDSIYNGLWTRAAALDAAAGGGWGQEVINDITGFATEEGLHAQTGVAIGGVLGRGIGNGLGNRVDNALGAVDKTPDGGPQAGSGIGGVVAEGAGDAAARGASRSLSELILERPSSNQWGTLENGTNQGVKHFSGYWERFPERIPSLETRLGLEAGTFGKSQEGFDAFTNAAESVVKNGEARHLDNGKSIYFVKGVENLNKGVLVIVKDGKFQTIMPSDPKTFMKME